LDSLFFFMLPPPPTSTLFPYTTLFRSSTGCPRAVAASSTRPAPTHDRPPRRLRQLPDHDTPCSGRESGRGDTEVGICGAGGGVRSEEHTSELQSQSNLVCRLLLEKKKK